LPNPFEFNDGSKVATFDDWSKRRNEIKADIEKYEIGEKPIPSDVTATYSGAPYGDSQGRWQDRDDNF
jgi:hypothetical protein